MYWENLIGLKIVALKCRKGRKGPGMRTMAYYEYPDLVFFDDGETYVQFEEQEYEQYHDADSLARTFRIVKDKSQYNYLMNQKGLVDYVSIPRGKEKI